MKKTYILLSTTLLLILLSGCFSPTNMIQFEIEADNLTESEKQEAIENIQSRLEVLGASNVSVVSEEEQTLMISYRGDFTSELLHKCFSTTGNLEFFEVCTSEHIMDYFLEKYPSAFEDENVTVENKDFVEFIKNVNVSTDSYRDDIFGEVTLENKASVEASPIFKTPIYIKPIKKRVKFLFGRGYENRYSLYAVLLSSTNESHIDGRYITNASFVKSAYGDRYVVDLQMNDEGAVIWEQLTGKVHRENGYIAIVVDDCVYSAPSVSSGSIKGGRSQISGSFTKDEVRILASAIHSGGIPKVKILSLIEL